MMALVILVILLTYLNRRLLYAAEVCYHYVFIIMSMSEAHLV